MNKRRGFTLIELMVVILILAILAALVVPRVIGKQEQAKRSKAASDITTLAGEISQFRLDCDRYPTTEEGLQALVSAPSDLQGKWHGPYIENIPPDPWQHPYMYSVPGQNGKDFQVMSYGADGQPGGDGDASDMTN